MVICSLSCLTTAPLHEVVQRAKAQKTGADESAREEQTKAHEKNERKRTRMKRMQAKQQKRQTDRDNKYAEQTRPPENHQAKSVSTSGGGDVEVLKAVCSQMARRHEIVVVRVVSENRNQRAAVQTNRENNREISEQSRSAQIEAENAVDSRVDEASPSEVAAQASSPAGRQTKAHRRVEHTIRAESRRRQSIPAYFSRNSLIDTVTDEVGQKRTDETVTNETARKAHKLRF